MPYKTALYNIKSKQYNLSKADVTLITCKEIYWKEIPPHQANMILPLARDIF